MRKFIATYELIGGISSLVVLFFMISTFSEILRVTYQSWTTELIATMIIGFCFSLTLLFAGLMLLKNKRSGYILSIIIQFLQMTLIQTPNFNYHFFAPLELTTAFGTLGLHVSFHFGAIYNFPFLLKFENDAVEIGFNLISLILFIILLELFRRQKLGSVTLSKTALIK